jgi:hypothetical protein
MELVELLDQILAIRNNGPRLRIKPFIFNEAMPPCTSKLRMLMSIPMVTMDYTWF